MRILIWTARRARFLLPLLPAAAFAALVETGDLPALVRAALAHNPDLAQQQFILAAAREEDDIARAPLLPQISAGASKTLEQGNASGGGENDSRRSIYVSLNQQIFNLPLWESHRAGEARVRAARARYAGAEQALRLSAVEAWLDFQLAGDLMRLSETRVEIAEEQYGRAQSFAEAGAGTVVDVLEAEARLAGLRADLLQSEYNYNLEQDRLYSISGLRGRRAHLTREGVLHFPPLQPLGEWLARVAQESHAAAAARADLESALALVRAADRVIFPRVALSAESRTNGALSERRENIVIAAEQTLYSGGGARAEARRVAANSAAARRAVRAVMRREELQTRELHGRAALAQSRWAALRASESAAAAALDATVAGYESGARIVADVLDAEETLFDARVQLRQARFNYLKDIAALRALAGAVDDEFVAAIGALFIPEGKEKSNV